MPESFRRGQALLSALAAILTILAVGLLVTRLYAGMSKQGMVIAQPVAAMRQGEQMRVESPSGAVNVNNADMEQLVTISGIGPQTAQNLIDEREQNGAFAYAEDLLNVKGIGMKTLEKLLPQICLE